MNNYEIVNMLNDIMATILHDKLSDHQKMILKQIKDEKRIKEMEQTTDKNINEGEQQ